MCPERVPVRPSIPPVFLFAACVWVGVILSERVSWGGHVHGTSSWTWCLPFAAALPVIAAIIGMPRPVCLVIAGLSLGMACGGLYWADWAGDVCTLEKSDASAWECEVASDPSEGPFGSHSAARMSRGYVEVFWPDRSTGPAYGTSVSIRGSVRVADRGPDGRMSHRKGFVGTIKPYRYEPHGPAASLRGMLSLPRERATEWLSSVSGDAGALLTGLLTGDRRRIRGTLLETDFRTTGLSHLLAVSGSHLVVLGVLCSWLLERLKVGRGWSGVLSIGILGAYVLFSGSQPSALRALAMSAVATVAGLSLRRHDTLAALGATVTVLLCTWPPAAFDVGFQLSVLAAGGIVLFGGLVERWVANALPRAARGVAPPLALTLVAQSVTAPVAIPVFGSLSLVAPLANLVCVPPVSAALIIGVLGLVLSALYAPAGHLVLMLAGAAASASAWAAARLAVVPGACILLAGDAAKVGTLCAMAAILVWTVWPLPTQRRARLVGLAAGLLLLALVLPSGTSDSQVTMLDVGQGDALLIESVGHAMLVDTGPDEAALRGALARAGVRRLDWLVVTHAHEDHIGGVRALSGVVPVARVAFPAVSAQGRSGIASSRGPKQDTLSAGDVVSLGRLRIEVLWPPPGSDGASNESSLVLMVIGEGGKVLLTGDAESGVLDCLVAAGRLGDVDVLKVGHHGSRSAVTRPLLRTLAPEVGLISVGSGNRFGHPAESTVGTLMEAGCKVFRTDHHGDVVVPLRSPGFSLPQSVATGTDAVRH